VPAGKGYLAYADADVEYAPGRWLLRPREVGKLLQHLRPREGDKALAIAAPTPPPCWRRWACRSPAWTATT
jgi:protein-L-isoaspartate(D-aspartate) O-methyltransferase